MKARRPNQRAGTCSLCGEEVAAGAGVIAGRTTGDDGKERWRVEHTDCEPAKASTVALWARYADGGGVTPGGLRAPRGASLVSGALPYDALPTEYVPLNDAAQALHRQMAPEPRRESSEHRAEAIARFGHTEATWNHGRPVTEAPT